MIYKLFSLLGSTGGLLLCLWPLHAQQAESTQPELVPASLFNLPDDLEIKVWAKSPDFYNPTNMDIDIKGRVWVTEAVNYRTFNANKNKGLNFPKGDRVVVLEDKNSDGKAETSTVFVQEEALVAPLGISVFDNEIYVASAPNLIKYTDVNRNLVFEPEVDKREIFLTGFGGLDHDHSLHAFVSGPDGALYTATGNAGPHIVKDKSGWTLRAGSSYVGGSPYQKNNQPGLKSDDGRVYVGGVALRIEQDGTGMEVIGHNFRNSYELVVNSFGDVFQNDNDDPPACRTTWLMKYGNLGFASNDGARTWRADQRPGQPVAVAEWRQQDPGILPAGDVYGAGAPTGIAYYENGALGKEYEGMLLSAESALSVIFGYHPKPDGAGFDLGNRLNFVSTKSNHTATPSNLHTWFRPSDIAIGADGAIYLSDWFDPGVGGHKMSDQLSHGSIYRIAPKNKRLNVPDIDLTQVQGQIEALKSPAPSVRMLGFHRLVKSGISAMPALKRLLKHDNQYIAARAIWVLANLGERGLAEVSGLLKSTNQQYVITAYRAMLTVAPELKLALAKQLIGRDHPALLREIALSLRDVDFTQKQALILKLAEQYKTKDPWLLEAIGTASEGDEPKVYKVLHQKLATDDANKWSEQFTDLAWRLHPRQAASDFYKRARNESFGITTRKASIDALAFISTQQAGQYMLELAINGPDDTRVYTDWWVRNRDTNDLRAFNLAAQLPKQKPMQAPVPITIEQPAYQSEILNKPKQIADIDLDITGANRLYLEVEQDDPNLNWGLGLWVNAYFIDAEGSRVALRDFPWSAANTKQGYIAKNMTARGLPITLPGSQKLIGGLGVNAPSTLFYSLSGHQFVRFVAQGRVDHKVQRKKYNEPKANIRFKVYHDGGSAQTQAGEYRTIKQILALTGDVERGEALFNGRAVCFTCHKIGQEGGDIGPDLTAIAKKFGTEYLLDSIINPSAAMSFGFETVKIKKTDNTSIEGFLVSDSASVVLKTIAGQMHSIAQTDIVSKTTSDQSIMPSAKLLGLSEQDLMDIIAYLQSLD
ncbi:PVC-type heme-binding CxxCH protein [Catenovulum adriaticum]|uniref:NPCBM/NEW2 domain-containing protein n=1 Tax=Catenovulum adriaticum TaxID=2984846 RepID=A0ABY7ARS1_9ALTE|nr:PVC-type heme-binding CxxCH protein [Catenovulum sp. TS8]WAJ71826.1 NPCBM/NEW2 domain-containing protein [Catenovulum sp. TS8]